MDLNDFILFILIIMFVNDLFEFVEESVVNKLGVVEMSGYEVSLVIKIMWCGDLWFILMLWFI